MLADPPRRRMLIANAAFYLAFAAATARAIFELRDDANFFWMLALLSFYLLLLVVEPLLTQRDLRYLHAINGLQTAVALVLLLFIGYFDYFSLLFIPPCTYSILHFPRRIALRWIGGITVLMVTALLVRFPLMESVGFVIIYPTAIFLFTTLSYLAKESEEAQVRGELLLVDLQQANRKLQAYAAQVQELAAASERNRLARELHDSVTQIIFGLTLSAQAARILIDRDQDRAVSELDHLQALAQSALAEMRALVQELHPRTAAGEGLAAMLARLAAERRSADGLAVELQVRGERRLSESVETELYRIIQEALNNIVKHARVDRAAVELDLLDPARVVARVSDQGVGFDLARARALPGHLGLTSMQERVADLGGTLRIDSRPGEGTRITVEIVLEQEVAHAG